MSKLIIQPLLIFIFLSLSNILAQNEHSLQINGGMIFPRSSSNGFSSSLQYSYSLSSVFDIYAYIGYNYWDRFKVIYIVELTPPQTKSLFNSYSSDDHILIPIYIGGKTELNTNKLFTSFINFEIGYSLFKYNSYENVEVTDIHTGATVDYKIIEDSKKEVTDHLFGIGIGAGIDRQLTKSIKIILSYKVNSNFNSGEFGLFSAKGTYYTLSSGISVNL